MPTFLKLAEKIFFILSLLFLTDAFMPFLGEVREICQQVILYVITTITTLLIVARWKKFTTLAIKEKTLWLLVGMALISAFWSVSPMLSFSRSINLLQVTLLGVYFATRYSLKEQLQLLAWALGIAALLSAVFAITIPRGGIMGEGRDMQSLAHSGAWRGIFGHKNVLGRAMVMSALVFLFTANNSHKHRWFAWIFCSLSIGLIALSTSKTALVILLTTIALLPLYKVLRWNNIFAVSFAIVLVLICGGMASLLVSNTESILDILGRDATLTGRTFLWASVFFKIWQHPWFGYGYAGFWQGWDGESAFIWRLVGWETPHAHNGFLDLWLDLGLVGLSIFAFLFVKTCLRAVTWMRRNNSAEGIIPLTYLLFLVLSNLTESSLMRRDIFWFLYVAITFSLHNTSLNKLEPKLLYRQRAQKEKLKLQIES